MKIKIISILSLICLAFPFSAFALSPEQVWGTQKYDEVAWLTTHNSFTNYEDSRWIVANQSKSIQHQLEAGVRGLMLDVWHYKSGLYLCHGDCEKFPVPGITYALPRQTVKGALQTVVNFLNSHPNDVVTLFLEDESNSKGDHLKNVLDSVSGLRSMMFVPSQQGVSSNGWPKVADMVRSNKRLLIFSDKSGHTLDVDAAWFVQNHWSIGDLGTDYECRTRWEKTPLDDQGDFNRPFIMNQFRNVPSIITAAIDNGSNLERRINDYCMPAAGGKKPNFIAVDFFELPLCGKNPTSIVNDLNDWKNSLPYYNSPPVWGVNFGGYIYRRDGNSWTCIEGRLKHVSVGSDGTVWGVNSSDLIYRYNGNNTWTNIPGRLKHVSVGSDGTVWGVNFWDMIYRYNGNNTWINIPGRLKQISVGSAGQVWGVNSSDYIFKWNGSSWTGIPGRLKYVSVSPSGKVWGVNSSDLIYRYNGNNTWTTIPGGLKQISVGK